MSHATQVKDNFTVTVDLSCVVMVRPFSHASCSSITSGVKYELIDNLGSEGPRIIPTFQVYSVPLLEDFE